MEDNDYETLQNLKAELESIGYTMDFGLDAEPYDLRKIGQTGKSEFYAKGGKLNTEVILTENRSNGAKWRGVVKPFMMKSIERNQYGGGFKRYEIDIYDDVEREPSKEELKQANEFFDKVGGRFAKGGMMADGGAVKPKIYQVDNGWNFYYFFGDNEEQVLKYFNLEYPYDKDETDINITQVKGAELKHLKDSEEYDYILDARDIERYESGRYTPKGENYEYVNTFNRYDTNIPVPQEDFEKLVDAYHKQLSGDKLDIAKYDVLKQQMGNYLGHETINEMESYISKRHNSNKYAKGGEMAHGGVIEIKDSGMGSQGNYGIRLTYNPKTKLSELSITEEDKSKLNITTFKKIPYAVIDGFANKFQDLKDDDDLTENTWHFDYTYASYTLNMMVYGASRCDDDGYYYLIQIDEKVKFFDSDSLMESIANAFIELYEQLGESPYDDDDEYAKGGEMAHGGGVPYKPYGKTKGRFKLTYEVEGEPQSEIRESLEEATDSARRYVNPKLGYTNVHIHDESGKEYFFADGGYTESGEKLYEIANNMSDKEFQEAFRNLSEKEKDLYESLLRLGDESKIALATVLNESKKPKYDKLTWDLHRYEKGGEMAKGGITPQLNEKVYAKAQEILKAEGITENISQKQFNQAYDKAIKEFGYSPAYFKKVMREFGPEYPHDDDTEFGDFMADGGETEDYYENLAVYVRGLGEIYRGNSMKEALAVANNYKRKNTKAKIVVVDDKIGDEYDLDGNLTGIQQRWYLWYAKGGETDGKYTEYEMVVLSKDADGKSHKYRFLISARNIDEAKQTATDGWYSEFGDMGQIFYKVMSDSKYRMDYGMADGGMIEPDKPIDKMTKLELMKFVEKIAPLKHFYPQDTISGRIQAKNLYNKYLEREKDKMADGGEMQFVGITDDEGNLIDIKVGDEVVEYRKRFPNAEEKTQIGSSGRVIKIVDNMAKVSFPNDNDYEEWIALKHLKKMAKGGMMSDGGEVDFIERMAKMRSAYENLNMIVKSKIAMAVGIDRAINIMENDYSIDPFNLITSAVRGGLLELDEINKDLVNEAVYEAENVTDDYRDSGQGISGSDMTAFTKNVLDSAGYKTGFINNRLERVDEEGNKLEIDKYNMTY
jgi:hypothetical protein